MSGETGQVTVRRAEPRDAGALISLFIAYRAFYRITGDDARAGDYIRRRLEATDGAIFVAVDDSHDTGVVGFAQCYDTYSSLQCARAWILNDLFVRPDARRIGVGSALLRHMEREARGRELAYIALSTERTNIEAQRRYYAHGYALEDGLLTFVKVISDEAARSL